MQNIIMPVRHIYISTLFIYRIWSLIISLILVPKHQIRGYVLGHYFWKVASEMMIATNCLYDICYQIWNDDCNPGIATLLTLQIFIIKKPTSMLFGQISTYKSILITDKNTALLSSTVKRPCNIALFNHRLNAMFLVKAFAVSLLKVVT